MTWGSLVEGDIFRSPPGKFRELEVIKECSHLFQLVNLHAVTSELVHGRRELVQVLAQPALHRLERGTEREVFGAVLRGLDEAVALLVVPNGVEYGTGFGLDARRLLTPCLFLERSFRMRTAHPRRSIYEEHLELLRGLTLAGHCGRNRERRECRTAEVGWGVGKNADVERQIRSNLLVKNRRLVRL